ncbi:MAG: DUF4296 domain-containing protein [Bacteroidetes bacterium]|nr:DUF4296 domain-containing protein [Bacteroidota bacterium]
MKSFLRFLIFTALLFSCSENEKIPNGIIPEKKMAGILWDLFRADEFLGAYVWRTDSTLNQNDESIRYYKEIFQLHQTSKEAFLKSFSYYKEHSNLMRSLLDSLIAGKTGINEELEPPKIPDSIRNIRTRKLNPKALE